MKDSLRGVRRRITAWYVGVFAVILLLFGAAIYWAVTRQIDRYLDQQLVAATDEIERAMAIREQERGIAGRAVDALQELHIPGRDLYVFDENGKSIGPSAPPPFVAPFGRATIAQGEVWGRAETSSDDSWRLYGRRIRVGNKTYAALAVAGAVEVEERYPGLLASFLAAAFGALVLVAVGGAALAKKSLVPVEQSMRRMRRFVADASHELRTPAAVLRTRAEVALQRARSVEEYSDIVERMKNEAERLGRLVDGLLLLAAADEDQLPLRKQPIFLDDVLVSASESARTLASSKGVTLELGDFQEAPVDADPELVRQLFMILLENAVKYTSSPGTVRVAVTADATRCRVSVRDTGPGVDAKDLPHLFERFYRVDASRAREGGSGLGLSIARTIAEAHDAEIALESQLGEGTTVRVSFPRRVMALLCALTLGGAAVAIGATGAAAQEARDAVRLEALALEDALARAEAEAPSVDAAAADSSMAAANLSIARAFPNPALSLGYSKSVPRYHVEAELPLDYPWLRGPRLRAAHTLLEASALDLDAARSGLRFQVEVAYAQAAGAVALQRLSAQSLDDGREVLRIVQAREASGDAATLDVAVAQVSLADLQGAMLADSLAALDAVIALQTLLGMPQDSIRIVPSDSLAAIPLPPEDTGTTPLRLMSADSTVAAFRSSLSLARRRRFPAPALRFGFEQGDPTGGEPGILPTLGIAIPLPIFDRGAATVASAEAALRRSQADRLAIEREIRSALSTTRRDWETARAQIAVNEDAVQSATQVAALTTEAYREGAYPLASVLEAQRSARDVLRRRIETLIAARQAAAAYRLAATAGGTTP